MYGVDLSAAAKRAGADTWVARCVPDGDGLVVAELASAAEFLDIDSTARDDVLPLLADHLGGVDGPAAAGVDVPFSLPAWVLGDRTWREFVAATPDEWGVLDGVGDPRDLYDAVREAADPEAGRPLRRATDEAHGGQDPAGYRIKTQTYYGISVLLRRLIRREGVCVPPALPPLQSLATGVRPKSTRPGRPASPCWRRTPRPCSTASTAATEPATRITNADTLRRAGGTSRRSSTPAFASPTTSLATARSRPMTRSTPSRRRSPRRRTTPTRWTPTRARETGRKPVFTPESAAVR